MFDFTIAVYKMCSSINGPLVTNVGGHNQFCMFSERHYPSCTCEAYRYGKRTINFGGTMYPKRCKHIIEADKNACGWHELYSGMVQTEEEEERCICPECGEAIVLVKVAT